MLFFVCLKSKNVIVKTKTDFETTGEVEVIDPILQKVEIVTLWEEIVL